MEDILNLMQIFISTSLVLVILFQVRDLGSGLFGSANATFRVRRGVEKMLFQLTIVLVVVFILVSIFRVRLT